MRKCTLFGISLILISLSLTLNAQTTAERIQFLKDYEQAVSDKVAYLNAHPELLQEATANGWFQQIDVGMQNARAFANGNGWSPNVPSIGATCETSEPFCTATGVTYPAGVNTGNAQSGPNYGCLGSQPNPAWYYMKVGTAGDIHITETNSANVDIDFILWGPFTSQNSCTQLTAGKIVDCSYSSQATEYIDINTSAVNDFFILLVTNFSNTPTNITMTQTSGSGATDCSILNPAPPPPVAGGASAVTATSFTANWGASTGATGYYLDVALDPGFTNFLPGYNNKNVGNVTSYNITGLSPGTSYFYRVRAFNANGTSTNSNTIVVTLPATIAGPTPVCQNSTGNTYTTQTGMSAYNWTVSAGGTITGGAGTSSITVTWTTAGAKTVNVSYSNTTSNTASGSYNVTVNALPVPTVAGPASICIYQTGTYTTQTGMTGYVWTVSAGGTITGGAGTSSITVNWGTAGAQSVTVVYTNASGCTSNPPVVYNVTVNPLPVPTITGSNSVCHYSTGNVYTTQAGMTNYIWSVSAGGMVTAGGTSTSSTVTVTWIATGPQTISVIYTNANGCTANPATVYNVTVNPLPMPSINIWNNYPCPNSTGNQFYSETGMSNYVWSVTGGGQITAGQGTAIVTITWTTPGLQTLSLVYTNTLGCTANPPGIYYTMVDPYPVAAGTITGSTSLCAGTNNVAYSTTTIANATSYLWTVPPGATIVSGAGTTSILVSYSASATSGNVTVEGVNQCGSGTPSSLAVTVNPLPGAAGTITGPSTVCTGTNGVSYTVPAISNATGYSWTVPSGVTIVSGGNTNHITVNFTASASSGTITVYGTNACGNGQVSPGFNVTVNPTPPTPVITESGLTLTSSAATGNQWYLNGAAIPGATSQTYEVTQSGSYYVIVTINGCSSAQSNVITIVMPGVDQPTGGALSVYPVPNDGRFTVTCTWIADETLSLEVYNSLGVKIHSSTVNTVQGKAEKVVDLRPVPDGVYTVVLKTEDNRVIRKILVRK